MKIRPEHLAHMRTAINEVLAKYPNAIEQYETGKFARSESVKDLQKRFCFDLMSAAGLTRWLCDNVYPYANDDHVYTALKAICPKVTRRYSVDDAITYARSTGRTIVS